MELIKLSVRQTTEGLQINAKSEVLEEFFRRASNGRGGTGNTRSITLSKYGSWTYTANGYNVPGAVFSPVLPMLSQGKVNCHLFALKGLGEGITVVLNEVHNAFSIEQISEGLAKAAALFYEMYIREIQYDIVVEYNPARTAVAA